MTSQICQLRSYRCWAQCCQLLCHFELFLKCHMKTFFFTNFCQKFTAWVSYNSLLTFMPMIFKTKSATKNETGNNLSNFDKISPSWKLQVDQITTPSNSRFLVTLRFPGPIWKKKSDQVPLNNLDKSVRQNPDNYKCRRGGKLWICS